MLNFFRKYQKYFLVMVAVMVTSSMVFFGTFSAISETQTKPDRRVGKAVDGSDLRFLEISALSRFIGADRDDVASGGTPNLLNDGVIRRDLISSGIAEILVRESFDLLKDNLSEKLHRIKVYKGYEHPGAPFVSAKQVWERISPAVNQLWSQLQTVEAVDPASFGQIAQIYQLQTAVPSDWLRRILVMQEQQYKQWLQPDARLRQEDLSLFGFHSLTDWFGKNFVDLMAEFIHNASIVAEENGYCVSFEEAKGDLKRIFVETRQKLQEAKYPNLYSYQDQLRMLGMDENEAVSSWQKVMLFRRYFQDLSNSNFLDQMPYTEFASVANEKAVVDLYQWPDALKLKSGLDVLALQTYVEAVAQKSTDLLSLPTRFSSVAEVEKKAPEMVATLYSAKVYAIDKREAALKAPLKEVWQFETVADTWDVLKKEFVFLQTAKTPEERFKLLNQLDPTQRSKVDSYARRLLTDKHPEWVRDALDAAEGKQTQLILSAGAIDLPHVKDPVRLGGLFQKILSSPETALLELNQFESGDAVFRFENIEKISDPTIKTFKEALADGSLTRAVDKQLESKFTKLRAKLPAEKKEKELSEVKEDLSLLMLKDIKLAIDKEKVEEGSFAAMRMGALAIRARADLMKNSNDPKWIRGEGESPLTAQFKLECKEKQITRLNGENWMTKDLFVLAPNTWTPIRIAPDGAVAFTYLKNREITNEPVLDKVKLGKEKIGNDIQCLLAKKLFARMQETRAVIIPLQNEAE